MKITKQQLQQIIKEEIENTMDEGFMDSIKGALGMGAKSQKCRTIHAVYARLKAEPPGYRSKDPAGEIDLEEWVERRKREHPECFSRDA